MTKEELEVQAILKDALHFHDADQQSLVAKHVSLFTQTYFEADEPEDTARIDQSFVKASRPLIKHLAENHHPHVTAIVTGNNTQLLEGMYGETINSYLPD